MPTTNPKYPSNFLGIRKKDLGFSYFDLVFDDITYILLAHRESEGLYNTLELELRSTYTDYDEYGDGHNENDFSLVMFALFSLRGFQELLIKLFLRESDIEYLPNSKTGYKGPSWTTWTWSIFKYRFRRTLYTLFTIPFSMWATVYNLLTSPYDTISRFWRMMTQTKEQQQEQKIHGVVFTEHLQGWIFL